MRSRLPKGWEEVELGDIIELTMGQSPKSEFYNEKGEGVPFMQGNTSFGEKYPTIERYTTKVTRLAKKNDILMSVRAPVGDLNICNIEELCIGRGLCSIRMKNNMQEFIYFLMEHSMKKLKSRESGTVFASINKKDLESLPISIPPLHEQKAIADTLSALDNKIETNNKINKNLEQQAQEIFKHWFVDFEFPDENGKPYKSSGGQMVESELGMIPEGWEVKNIGDMTTLSHTGGDAIRKVPIVDYNTGIKCARVGDLSNNRPINEWAYCDANEDNFEKYKLEKGDLLVTRTARLGLNKMIYEDTNAVFNNGLIRLRFKPEYELSYIKYMFNNSKFMSYINMITGDSSTRPNMKIKYLLDYTIPLAPQQLQKQYKNLVGHMISHMQLCIDENQRLSSLRDTLLPKLMSGEIRIPLD